MILRRFALLLPLLALVPLAGCSSEGENGAAAAADERPTVAFVTNCVDPFWVIAKAGVEAAAAEFDVQADVRMPPNREVGEQKRFVEELLAREVDGIAISPIDGVNQAALIDEACARTNVITHDSDAPGTKRLCYVGMDNYAAGRECGKLVKEALPEGGTVMIFVGGVEQNNARLRRQGVIDELLDRAPDPSRFDSPSVGALEGAKYTILDTRTDNADHARAKANAEDAISRFADLGCMVGLFAYNVPACVEALEGAGKRGAIAVCGFDEQDGTLRGIEDGWVHGTVTQQPYEYGYQSVRILAALARGDRSVLPADGYVDVPVQVVKKANVAEFKAALGERLASGE